MQTIEDLQSELRVLSVKHSNELAKVKKHIQSILDYDLAIAMDMLDDGVSSDRVLKHLQSVREKVLLVKQIGEKT
jgi:stage III sporulation protein SpoIIIAA